jgi:hypothetical protein
MADRYHASPQKVLVGVQLTLCRTTLCSDGTKIYNVTAVWSFVIR